MELYKILQDKNYLEIIEDHESIVIKNCDYEVEVDDLIKFTYHKIVERYGKLFTDKDGYEKLEVKTDRVTLEHKNLYQVKKIVNFANERTIILKKIL